MSMHIAPAPHMTPHHYGRNITYGVLTVLLLALGIGAIVQIARPGAQPGADHAPAVAITQAWQIYRAGERLGVAPLLQRDEATWQIYRAGERLGVAPLVQRDETTWQIYRAGERLP